MLNVFHFELELAEIPEFLTQPIESCGPVPTGDIGLIL